MYLFFYFNWLSPFRLSFWFCFHSARWSRWLCLFRKVLLAMLCKFVSGEKSSIWLMITGIFFLSVWFGYEHADQQNLRFSQLSVSRFVLQLVSLLNHCCSESLNKDTEPDADSCSGLIMFSSLKKIVQTFSISQAG